MCLFVGGRVFNDISVVERCVLGWFGGELRCLFLGEGFW